MATNSTEIDKVKRHIKLFIDKLDNENIDDLTVSRLQEVLNTIDNDPYVWTNINLYDVFNPSMFVDRARIVLTNRRTVIGFFEVSRNILVLFPIVLTWYSLSAATKAYSVLEETNLNIPFLYQWEQGFNGLIPSLFGYSLTFSHVAFIDALLIGLIMFMTAIVYWRSFNAEQKAMNLGAELDNLLWEINQAINADLVKVKGDAEHRAIEILESVNNFISEFRKQGQELNEITSKGIARFEALTKDYSVVTEKLDRTTKSLGDSTEQLEALKIEIEEIHSKQDQIVDSSLSIEGQIGGFNRIITEFGRILEKFTTNTASNMSTYYEGMENISKLSKESLARLQEINDRSEKIYKDRIDRLEGVLNKFTSETKRTNDQLSEILGEISQLRKSLSNPSTIQLLIEKLRNIAKK